MPFLSESEPVCPSSLLEQAQQCPKVSTAVVGSDSVAAIEGAMLASQANIMAPVFIGESEKTKALAAELDWDISQYQLLHCDTEAESASLAAELAKKQEVHALMKGNIKTPTLLKAVLSSSTGLLEASQLSHVFRMSVGDSDQALFITDAVVNVSPSVKGRCEIVKNAYKLLKALNYSAPKFAVLSASEKAIPSMPSSEDAIEIITGCRDAIAGINIDGPFAFDNAISPEAASLKGLSGDVAGQADVLVVPNIETGNALFKMMVYFMGATAAGLTLGAKVPIILTSRADPPAARLAGAALSSIYSQYLLEA